MLTFYWLAVSGLIISLIIHVSTFLGVDPKETLGSWVVLLHIGALAVFGAAVIWDSKRIKNDQNDNELDFKISFQGAPSWAIKLFGILFIYVMFNTVTFVFMALPGNKGPREENGRYYLANNQYDKEEITEQEFHRYQANEIRFFSGGWMIFYSFSGMILYSQIKQRKEDECNDADFQASEK